ncbi:hypothetical protein [Nostoc parmelioides]|uniref:Uncharacterized protein n=1 Tax=Nostoc parmelioides FACHB-3921 TaxID=2692909 RepID=A0ABR8BMI9_9NOSO|nr:hypothetical protein [Nostoc parmelioides]MBD2255327.1 hypothetical protein [Nostoc parmelioides FACHB-3921]
MDLDLKIYIPLLAACITSTAALIVGIINWRTNIKIRNQQFLINIIEKDINELKEIQIYLLNLLPRLLYIHSKLESSTITFDEAKELFDILCATNLKIANLSPLLKQSSLFNTFTELKQIIHDGFDSKDSKTLLRYTGALSSYAGLLNSEIAIKKDIIKSLFV